MTETVLHTCFALFPDMRITATPALPGDDDSAYMVCGLVVIKRICPEIDGHGNDLTARNMVKEENGMGMKAKLRSKHKVRETKPRLLQTFLLFSLFTDMQHYRPITRLLKRAITVDQHLAFARPFTSLTTTANKHKPDTKKDTTATDTLSNRQKFNQIQPPIKLYEKLEKLGFGTLLKTKRYSGLHKQKARRDQQRQQYTERVGPPPEPKYAVSLHYMSIHSACHSSAKQFPLLSFFAGAKVPTSFPPESLDEIAFVGMLLCHL